MGPEVLTLCGQQDLIRAGGLGRDPLAWQVLAWVYLVSVVFILCVRDFPPTSSGREPCLGYGVLLSDTQ